MILRVLRDHLILLIQMKILAIINLNQKESPKFLLQDKPDLRSQIGGPDGFYFGDLRLRINSELIMQPNITITSEASIGIIDNLDELRLPQIQFFQKLERKLLIT